MSNNSSKNDSYKKNSESNNQEKPLFIEGEERKMHEELIKRRITGGDNLSDKDITKAYDRALRQWQELPGSIVQSPTDVIPSQKLQKSQKTQTIIEQTDNDIDKGEESE
jgi:hypothetical protein